MFSRLQVVREDPFGTRDQLVQRPLSRRGVHPGAATRAEGRDV